MVDHSENEELFKDLKKRKAEKENYLLSPKAQKSYETKGRLNKIDEELDARTPFMRDRDRIVHSSSFRRMKDKTQVFLLSKNDMIRTRLSHTLEVSQIAKTIANVLELNEDLVEAIALGHDLGHAPFGHIGERALSEVCGEWFQKDGVQIKNAESLLSRKEWLDQPFSSFRHNIQSLRVVDFLENKGQGLNLTFEVRDGIVNHSKWGKGLLTDNLEFLPKTLEGQIVRISDRIAYVNHDLQDSIRMGMTNMERVPQQILEVLGDTHSKRINTAVLDVIVKSQGKGHIMMTNDVAQAVDSLYDFLFEEIYRDHSIREESLKAEYIVKELAFYYKSHPEIILELTQDIQYSKQTSLEQKIVDHIANMTDHYIVREFSTRLLPIN